MKEEEEEKTTRLGSKIRVSLTLRSKTSAATYAIPTSHIYFRVRKFKKMISVEVIKRYNYPRIFTLLSTTTQPIHLIARFLKNSKTNLCCRNLQLWFECQLAIGTPDQDSSLQITAAPALYTGATHSLALSVSRQYGCLCTSCEYGAESIDVDYKLFTFSKSCS